MGTRNVPNYEYLCEKCGEVTIHFIKYDNRDDPQTCDACGAQANRAWVTAPQIRTPKTSRTFVDGIKRPGMEDGKKIADLQVEQLKHRPNSKRYHEIKSEIMARKQIRKDTGKYKLGEKKSDKKKD